MTIASSPPAADPACRRPFYGWVILVACFIVTTVASGTMMGFGVFITPMAEDMGWSHSALSFSYALSAMVTGIGVLIVGSFLHSHSVRLIFFMSTLVHCFGIYMTSTATTIEAFYFWYGFVASVGTERFFSVHDHVDHTVVRETSRPGHGHHDVWQRPWTVYLLASDHLDDFYVGLANGLRGSQRLDDRLFVVGERLHP